ncbi:SpoIID/LytB domain-containing protein [Nocardioides sp. W7]|uniref:SpoIID/LytB domain-containing protein n=1 Tax=Nocardioides sp. W7 TaxID=2931390 RepID=UPI001FD37C27|nr:SpoIID/LytB domain-containing protein [Nocardioides sp. W7]
MRHLVLPAALAAVLALVPGASSAAEAASAAEAGPARLVLQGHGWGHGHGMSQYGAQGAALQGRSHRQILGFYYPGTKWGRAGGRVRVLISADTSADVVVRARAGLQVRSLTNGNQIDLAERRPAARAWRITAPSPTRSLVSWKGRSGGWHPLRTLKGDAQFQATGPITLVTPAGSVAYRGALRSATVKPGRTARDTVNVVSLESYLRGVVPAEVIASSWRPAALRAQSVAARTYAAYERRQPLARHYQICDTAQCQVYTGTANEHPRTDDAIRRTRARVLTHRGRPAFTQFSSSNGGWTSAGGFPYLPAKRDPYDATPSNPNHTWRHVVRATAIEAAWPALGAFRRIRVLERDGHGAWGGRVERVRVVGSRTSTTVSGDTFRSYLGLKSDWFRAR